MQTPSTRTALPLLLALLTLPLLHSCCRRDKIRIDEERAISLNVSSTGTKAVVGSLTDMVNQCYNGDNRISGAGFGVYGYKKQADNTSARLFNDILVQPTSKTESPSWEYTPTRYWDSNPSVSYQFIAYWPYLTNDPDELNDPSDPYVSVPEAVNGDYSSKVLTIHNVPNWQPVTAAGTEMDFMTAAASGKYRSSDQNEALAFSDGTVRFSFSHILSQLIIKAYYVGAQTEVFVRGITLSLSDEDDTGDILNGAGSDKSISTDFRQRYDQDYASPLRAVPSGENANDVNIWDITPNPYTLWSTSDQNEYREVAYLNEEGDDDFEPSVIGHWLMVPHKWKNLVLTLDRTIGGNNGTGSATLTLGEPDNNDETLPGKTYVVTLMLENISGEGLTVQSIVVQDWDESAIDREVYNW